MNASLVVVHPLAAQVEGSQMSAHTNDVARAFFGSNARNGSWLNFNSRIAFCGLSRSASNTLHQ